RERPLFELLARGLQKRRPEQAAHNVARPWVHRRTIRHVRCVVDRSTVQRISTEEHRMEPWRTAIVDSRDGQIRFRGYDATALMAERTFTDVIFLLHQSRLPTTA